MSSWRKVFTRLQRNNTMSFIHRVINFSPHTDSCGHEKALINISGDNYALVVDTAIQLGC